MTDSPRPIEKDDLNRFKWLQGGRFSPDGTQVIYVVSYVDAEAEKEYADLWLFDIASGHSRQMTSGKYRDGAPEWSPDGTQIAFVSNRVDDKPQVYILPVNGGEARQFTTLKHGASSPKWSPDGSQIAFTAGIERDEDDKTNNRSKYVYRVTRNVWRFNEVGDTDRAVNNVYVMPVDGDEPTQLTDHDVVTGDLKWSQDGSQLLYAAYFPPDKFRVFTPSLQILDLDGSTRELLADWGEITAPHWSPDGTKIVFVGQPDGNDIGTKSDLYVLDIATESLDNRTPSLESHLNGWVGGRTPTVGLNANSILFSEDGATIYVRVQRGGSIEVLRVALSGDESHQAVLTGDRVCLPMGIHGDTLLFASDHINAAPDLYTAKTDGTDEKQITHLNKDLMAGFTLPEWENLHFKGADGTDVEGWYIKPPVGDAPYPTILYIHGGPHSSYGNRFSFDFQMLAGAGYGVLFINHRASTGYGNRFATMIKGDWGNHDYHDLMAGVDYAIERGLADADRLGCCGTSGGGNLSCWIVGQTDRFKAAIPQNPVTNWLSFYGVSDIGVWFSVQELGGHPHEIPDVYRKCSPITHAHNCTTPTLMVQSEYDWRCPPEQSEQFYTVLKANGCTVEMLRQPGGAHGASITGPVQLRMPHLEAMLDWFGRYVKGETTDETSAG